MTTTGILKCGGQLHVWNLDTAEYCQCGGQTRQIVTSGATGVSIGARLRELLDELLALETSACERLDVPEDVGIQISSLVHRLESALAVSGPASIREVRARLDKRRAPSLGTCTVCGHQQEMMPSWQPAAHSMAEAQWRCQSCGGQIQVTFTVGGDEPTADEDIETLLAALGVGEPPQPTKKEEEEISRAGTDRAVTQSSGLPQRPSEPTSTSVENDDRKNHMCRGGTAFHSDCWTCVSLVD